MRHVVVAPDKFKGSLTAAEVAKHLAVGLEKAGLDVECVPVADGGDGIVAAMVTAGYATRTAEVTGPLGDKLVAQWACGNADRMAASADADAEASASAANQWERGEAGGMATSADPAEIQAHTPKTAQLLPRMQSTLEPPTPTAPPTREPSRPLTPEPSTPPTPKPTPSTPKPPRPSAEGRPGVAGAVRSAVGLGPALGQRSQHPNVTKSVAVVELAQASGLTTSPQPLDALRATSRGTGELLHAARDSGCSRIVLGVGGSACTDGGAGMLQALGVRLLDADGRDLPPGGAALRDLATIDAAGVPRGWRDIDITVACDVDNPLLGPNGAAAVYGPQKGASPSDVAVLEAGLARFAEIVHRDLGVDVAETPGAGAAGGVAYGALAFLGARLRSGIELVLDLLDFDDRLAGADLVITGEGRVDIQTVRGKAPAGVAAAAARAGIPTIAVAGTCDLEGSQLTEAGISAVYPLSDLEPDPDRSIRDAGPLLEQLAARIAAERFPTEGRP